MPDKNSSQIQGDMGSQSLATDQFFYFFLRLRKGEIRRTVQVLQSRYPDESPAQLAQRLIESKATLSLIGGTLLHLPLLFPGIGQALKLLGVVGATSLLTRMHLYLVLEIALVFGKDIDDQARVPEMAAVVAATGASAATPWLVQTLELHPLYALPAGSLSAAAMSRLIGESAIRFYSQSAHGAVAGTGEV
jgi:hypothetical protein